MASFSHCPLCGSDTQHFHTDQMRDYYECCQCGLVFADPNSFLDAKDEKERYELHENNPEDEGYRQFLRQVMAPLLPHLKPGQKGLDFGCGPGPALKQLLEEQGMAMQVYDPFYAPDQKALEMQYDFVTCTEVVEHFYTPAESWNTLIDLVKPGGWLAIMTSFLTKNTDFNAWYYKTEPTHVMFYRTNTIEYIAERFQLKIVHIQSPVVLFQKPIKA